MHLTCFLVPARSRAVGLGCGLAIGLGRPTIKKRVRSPARLAAGGANVRRRVQEVSNPAGGAVGQGRDPVELHANLRAPFAAPEPGNRRGFIGMPHDTAVVSLFRGPDRFLKGIRTARRGADQALGQVHQRELHQLSGVARGVERRGLARAKPRAKQAVRHVAEADGKPPRVVVTFTTAYVHGCVSR